jgi:hypothetical protein
MKRPDSVLGFQSSHLFILHLWADKDKPNGFYGKIQHAPQGDCLYFSEWEVLIHFLEGQNSQNESDEGQNPPRQPPDYSSG